jgi:hypothetical protein
VPQVPRLGTPASCEAHHRRRETKGGGRPSRELVDCRPSHHPKPARPLSPLDRSLGLRRRLLLGSLARLHPASSKPGVEVCRSRRALSSCSLQNPKRVQSTAPLAAHDATDPTWFLAYRITTTHWAHKPDKNIVEYRWRPSFGVDRLRAQCAHCCFSPTRSSKEPIQRTSIPA